VVSRCIEFAHCRWNGLTISDPYVRKLGDHVTFCPVCPEVRIGLGVPRDPIRVCRGDDEARLYQPATGRDVTGEMRSFAAEFLDALGDVDGFILKSRSPSCGMKDVKIYASTEPKAQVAGKGRGLFGEAVLERFGHLAIEDEGRMHNFLLRHHFLTKLFTLAAFRELREAAETEGQPGLGPLVAFHTRNKWLLMAQKEQELRALGRVVANHERRPAREVYDAYAEGLARAFARPAKYKANINVLMHALGFVGDGLSSAEKAHFLEVLETYRAAKVPLSVPLGIVKSWGVRFEKDLLLDQTFLAPYPEPLVEITDSGKGRGA
jgi:uncharacterized protein YbgA (DUF1722 family)/uncharacterized protein YbbK (DUF523 family)